MPPGQLRLVPEPEEQTEQRGASGTRSAALPPVSIGPAVGLAGLGGAQAPADRQREPEFLAVASVITSSVPVLGDGPAAIRPVLVPRVRFAREIVGVLESSEARRVGKEGVSTCRIGW